jgi:hypothetical protein
MEAVKDGDLEEAIRRFKEAKAKMPEIVRKMNEMENQPGAAVHASSTPVNINND